MLTREDVIDAVCTYAQGCTACHALWLEGADGLGTADIWSDLDFWFDVDDAARDAFLRGCAAMLAQLSPIDSLIDLSRAEIGQLNLHLKDTPPTLFIDLCAQNHSRDRRCTCFVRGDLAEAPLVLFDRAGVITFCEPEPPDTEALHRRAAEAAALLSQHARFGKYLLRRQLPEAVDHYLEYVLLPIVTLLRVLHVPSHADYGLCHLSDHLPPEALAELLPLFQMQSLESLEAGYSQALALAEALKRRCCARYGWSEL